MKNLFRWVNDDLPRWFTFDVFLGCVYLAVLVRIIRRAVEMMNVEAHWHIGIAIIIHWKHRQNGIINRQRATNCWKHYHVGFSRKQTEMAAPPKFHGFSASLYPFRSHKTIKVNGLVNWTHSTVFTGLSHAVGTMGGTPGISHVPPWFPQDSDPADVCSEAKDGKKFSVSAPLRWWKTGGDMIEDSLW